MCDAVGVTSPDARKSSVDSDYDNCLPHEGTKDNQFSHYTRTCQTYLAETKRHCARGDGPRKWRFEKTKSGIKHPLNSPSRHAIVIDDDGPSREIASNNS